MIKGADININNCKSCHWSADLCCPKNRAKGKITCMNPKHQGPPLEMLGGDVCKNFKKADNG